MTYIPRTPRSRLEATSDTAAGGNDLRSTGSNGSNGLPQQLQHGTTPNGVIPPLNPSSRPGRARFRVRRVKSRGWLVLGVLALVVGPASALLAATSDPVKVPVSSSDTWTNTGVNVGEGDSISIEATGLVHFGPSPIDAVAPAGLPAAACAAITEREGRTRPFSAPGLRCWSLIGKIGSGPPFQVGANKTLRAPSAGELFLGVNDNRLADNIGAWSAAISVTPSSGGSDSKLLPILALAALAGVALVAILLLLRRRRRVPPDGGEPTDPPVDVPDVVPVAVPADVAMGVIEEAVAPEAVTAALGIPDELVQQSVAPVEGEFVDVNIFEVQLSNGTDLRVGYNYFPEGTDLHWQVRQGSLFARGRFATNGGGSLYHYVTLPLGVHLEPDPGSVDVEFSWTIEGVPFRYSVRRDPGY